MGGKVMLCVFAHPDDETSGVGGTMALYARRGAEVFVATATRGEQGSLGAGGMVYTREELPEVRERELRDVLRSYGVHPPILLGYRDQEVEQADPEEVVGKVLRVMEQTRPDVIVTFGPLGISRHADHMAVHRATVEAFHRYRREVTPQPRLFYVAIPEDLARRFELDIEGPEVQPTVLVDIDETISAKVRALYTYASQEDAQQLAGLFEERAPRFEAFHQAYPTPDGRVASGFWE